MLNNYKIDHDNIELPSTLLASAGDTTSTTVFGKQTAFGAPREESSKEESSCLRALTMQAELARLRSFVQGGGRGGRGGRRGGSSRGDVAQLGPEPTLLLRLLHPDHSTQNQNTSNYTSNLMRKIHSLHSSLLISQTTIVVFKINSSFIFFQNY